MKIDGVLIELVDYKGRTYNRFHVRRDEGKAPGWFVWGRNPEYGDNLIHLCARPDVKLRAHPHYNYKVRRGWPTKKEAQAIADRMNKELQMETGKITGIHLKPNEKMIELVEFEPTLEEMYRLLKCHVIEMPPIDNNGNVLVVDEEGRLMDHNEHGYFAFRGHQMCGMGLIVAINDQGETVSTTLTIRDVAPLIQWLK